MNKFEKGDYGYLKSYRRNKLIVSIILAAMIEFIVITMLVMHGTTSTVFIVFAILLALPLAKFLISFFLCIKFKPLNEEQHDVIENATKNTKQLLCYDIVISQYEGIKFYQSLCVKNGHIYALVLDKKESEQIKDYKKWIENSVSDIKYEYKVHMFEDIDSYIKMLKKTPEPDDRTMLIDQHILDRIFTMGV